MAAMGHTAVAEMQFADYIVRLSWISECETAGLFVENRVQFPAFDQMVNE